MRKPFGETPIRTDFRPLPKGVAIAHYSGEEYGMTTGPTPNRKEDLRNLREGILKRNMNYVTLVQDSDLGHLGRAVVTGAVNYLSIIQNIDIRNLGEGILKRDSYYIALVKDRDLRELGEALIKEDIY